MSITPTSGSGGFEPQVDQSTQADTSSSAGNTSKAGSGSTVARYSTGTAKNDKTGKTAKQMVQELGKVNHNLKTLFRPSRHAVTQQTSSLSSQEKADILRKRL